LILHGLNYCWHARWKAVDGSVDDIPLAKDLRVTFGSTMRR